MKPEAADNSVPREISALLSNQRLILRETQRAVTPLGGVAVFVAFLHKLGFVEKLRQHMPIQWKSPQPDRSHSNLHGVSHSRTGGSQTLCSRQLVTQRSRLACLAGPVPLSH
jgi:hypothetical protein